MGTESETNCCRQNPADDDDASCIVIHVRQLTHIVTACRTSQHGGEAVQVGAAAPSVAEALDALKVPREVKKTN